MSELSERPIEGRGRQGEGGKALQEKRINREREMEKEERKKKEGEWQHLQCRKQHK